MPKGSRLRGLWAELVPLSLTSGSCILELPPPPMMPGDAEAAAAWTKMVSASTTAHDEPNMDGIGRPIFVPILVPGDAIILRRTRRQATVWVDSQVK